MNFFTIIDNNIFRIKLNRDAQKIAEKTFISAKINFENYVEGIKFSANYTPDKDEYFYIEDFESSVDFDSVIDDIENIPEFGINKNYPLEDIKAIFSIDNDKNILIQYFSKRNIIDLSKTIFEKICHSHHEFVVSKFKGLTLSNDLIAIIRPNKKIMFRSFYLLRHIFDMDKYFHDATDEDVNKFIKLSNIFDTDDNFDFNNNIDNSIIRKKITIINQTKVLINYSVSDLIQAAKSINYPLPVNQDSTKITLPSVRKEFKDLLNFLTSNIYRDPITGDIRITNSSRLYT